MILRCVLHFFFSNGFSLAHCQVIGEVMMSFPAEILSKETLPKLAFRIGGRSTEQVQVHSQLIGSEGDLHSFNEVALLEYLKVRSSTTSLSSGAAAQQ